MKKLLLSFLLLIPSYGLSQTQNPTLTRTYDLDTNNLTTQGLNIANRNITSHIFTWSVQRGAMTACTLSFQTSFNNSTWTAQTTGDCSATGTTGYLTFTANYIRIVATTFTVLTAPATVTVSWAGYIVSPASGDVTGIGTIGECAVFDTTTSLTSDPCGTGVSAAAGQILYGTGASYTSSSGLKYLSATGFGTTPGILMGTDPDSIPYKLGIGGSVTEEAFTVIKSIVHVIPPINGTDIIGINSEVFGDDGASGLTANSVEMYGAYIEATSLSTNGASGLRGLHVGIRSGLGAFIDGAVGIEIGTAMGGATVTTLIGLNILNVGGSNKAIVTGTGIVEFGDTVNMLSGASIASIKTPGAATGKKVVCVDQATGILYGSSTGTGCDN